MLPIGKRFRFKAWEIQQGFGEYMENVENEMGTLRA